MFRIWSTTTGFGPLVLEDEPITRLIDSFLDLDESWSIAGHAQIVNVSTANAAKNLYKTLFYNGFSHFEAQPGLAGEILVRATYGDKVVDAIVTDDLQYELYAEEGHQEVLELESLTETEVQEKIREVARRWHLSYELSTQHGSMTTAESADSHSVLREMAVFPFSMKSVRSTPADQFVFT